MENDADAAEGLEKVDLNPGLLFDKLDTWIDGFVRLVPNLIVAFVVLALFWIVATSAAWAIRRTANSRGRASLGAVGGSIVKGTLILFGFLLAATIVMPTLNLGSLVAGLGVGSVAIGFAFKDILQNMLAGILILIRQPFRTGDQIVSGDYEGTVEQVEIRATMLRTYDGRRVVIPNSDVYTRAVTVNTAYDSRRSEYDFGIHYEADTAHAMDVAVEAARAIDGVRDPEAFSTNLGDFAKAVRLRWWTEPTQKDVVHLSSDVMLAVEQAFAREGIGIPFPTRTLHVDGALERAEPRRQAAE